MAKYIDEIVYQQRDKSFEFGVLENSLDRYYEPIELSGISEVKQVYGGPGCKYLGSHNIWNYQYSKEVKTEVFYDKTNDLFFGVFKVQQ